MPRISALYPPGARAGSTVEVAIRGGGLEGAKQVLVDGGGLSATLNTADVKVDPADQKVFQAKCALCHELRGPTTISRTTDQWVATLDRMIKDKAAPIEAADRGKIENYLKAAARAAAGLTARVTVAADAAPGERQIRVVAANGTSTVFPFEVSTQPEALEAEPNNELKKAPPVTLPVTVSGQIGQTGDVDCFSLQAKKGERVVFNCDAYRLNPASQAIFFPVLYLYDDTGKELAKNAGYFSLDPLIDWTAPADGKFIVMIRDMLYRGSPGSVYRLAIGSLPYKTYLFPAGGKRGTSFNATVSGENMAPAAASIALPADAPAGVRQVSTSFGSFPVAVGEYEEYVEKPGPGPQSVSLPVSINGRLEAAGSDRYAFTLDKDHLGPYTFEVFAERIGSPVSPRLTLLNSKGQAVGTSEPGRRRREGRDTQLDVTLNQPGDYTLVINDESGKYGPDAVYNISAGPSAPDFDLVVGPDNPNLGPGASVYLQLRVQRRTGVPGDIEVTVPSLPPGVTASPAVLHAGDNQAFLILTAAADAKPGSFALARVVGKAMVDGKPVVREAVPYDFYRINNNVQIAYRSNMVVTVGPEPDYTVSLEPSAASLSANGKPVEVKVRLNRKGNERDLPFAIIGLPPGVQGPGSILFKRGQNELSFTLRPTNGGVFAPNSPPMTRFLLAVVTGREGEGMMMASPAVPIAVSPQGATAP